MKKIILLLCFGALSLLNADGIYAVTTAEKTEITARQDSQTLHNREKKHSGKLKKFLNAVPGSKILRSVFKKEKTGARQAKAPIHKTAKLSLIFALSSFLILGIFGAIGGVVFGIIALKRIKESAGFYRGRGMAMAGLIIGGVVIIASAFFIYALFAAFG